MSNLEHQERSNHLLLFPFSIPLKCYSWSTYSFKQITNRTKELHSQTSDVDWTIKIFFKNEWQHTYEVFAFPIPHIPRINLLSQNERVFPVHTWNVCSGHSKILWQNRTQDFWLQKWHHLLSGISTPVALTGIKCGTRWSIKMSMCDERPDGQKPTNNYGFNLGPESYIVF